MLNVGYYNPTRSGSIYCTSGIYCTACEFTKQGLKSKSLNIFIGLQKRTYISRISVLMPLHHRVVTTIYKQHMMKRNLHTKTTKPNF